MTLLLLGAGGEPNVRSLFAQNELGLAIDIGDRNGASEAKRTWRRNLLTYSEQFDNAAWTKLQSSVTANSATAPDGTTTADSLIEDSSTNTHLVLQIPSGVSANTVFTMSVYVKPNGRNWIRLVENNGSGIAAYFDIQNGALGTVLGGTTAISSVGNGWYRCSIRGTTGAAQTSINFNIRLANANGGESYTGNGTSGVFIWGAQVELGTSTDYQPITDFNTEFKSAYPNHSLYVDSNGVAPAVYPGDQIGLVIDSSRGGLENLGAELITVQANRDFSSDTGYWTKQNGTITISGGVVNFSSTGDLVALYAATSNLGTPSGKFYLVEFEIKSISAGGIRFGIGGEYTPSSTATGVKRFILRAGAFGFFGLYAVGTTTATVDNISVKEIPGIHPYQTTSGSRPALCRTPDGGRRNLLTGTDAMATQSLTVLAVQHTLSFQGTGTVTLSGASTSGPLVGTGATNIVSLTFTPTAGSLTLTVTGTVQLAQLETGASRTAYQKVGLTSDVTESGKRDCWGLLFDGSDDSLQTASVDFSATDKMTVMTGVRKNTSSAGIVVELGASFSANTGSVYLLGGNDPTDRWWSASRGTQVSNADQVASVTVAAPDTAVISSVHDIAGDSTTIRRNSVADTTATGEKGSGNFRNDILYIGSRSGSLRFNGLIYTLIVRGATTPTGTIADFERNLLARRCGVTF